jgi:prolipoprotein diacylglyceryltransferase
MIPYKEVPMFMFGPLRFNMYGIMFAVGLMIAHFIATKEGKKIHS